MRVLFVCTGNICRSPMAEYMLRDLLREDEVDLEVDSAGVAAVPGRPASPPAVRVLREKGILGIEGHRSQPVSSVDLEVEDYLLTMTPGHLARIPEERRKRVAVAATLKDFVGRHGGFSDPYGGDVQRYRSLRDEMEPVLHELVDRISPSESDSGESDTTERGGG